MNEIIKKNYSAIVILGLYSICGFYLIMTFGKVDLHIKLNSFNSPFLDVFFKYTTQLAEAYVVIAVGILLSFRRIRQAIAFVLSVAFAGLTAQMLKRVVFPDYDRPSKFLETFDLHFVEGVPIHKSFSFPSGHSSAGMAVFFYLALLSKNVILKVTFTLIGLLIAYSRVYLSQHFLVDTIAGIWIGAIYATLFYLLLVHKQIFTKPWLDKTIRWKSV